VTWDDDLINGAAYLMSTTECAGTRVNFSVGDQPQTEVTLSKDGDRSIAQIRIAGPQPGEELPSVTVAADGQVLKAVVPDIHALRLGRFQSGASSQPGRRGNRTTTISARPAIFTTYEFPPTGYPDLKYVEKLVGSINLKTTFFDATDSQVASADRPGRYIAKVDVQNSEASFTTYLTLFRAPENWQGETKDVRVACAAFEGKLGPGSRPDAARKADQDAIHALRKRLGTQIKYEYVVNLPTDYKPDSDRRWPLIVYLHGSGGGEEPAWDTARYGDGPMGYGHKTPNFPFVTVALRSHGGWFPPAVEDVIDEVLAKYSIDTSRIYLMGFSMGGFGTWATAYDRPDRFAAIAPVAAGGGDASLMPLLKNLPVWVFNGGDDEVTSPRAARAAVEELRQAGGTVRYTEYPGMEHGDSLRLAFAEKDLYTWLLQFKTK
jgi:acetyl esterase/lipase